MMKPAVALAVISLLISGCATLNKEDCQTAAWQVIGYEDGLQGYSPGRLQEHRQACARYNVEPDASAYQVGHTEGVNRYCTAANAYTVGRSGQAYASVCPKRLEPEFLRRYEAGKQLYEAEQQVARLEAELRLLESDVDNLEQTLIEKEARQIDDRTSDGRRRFTHDQMQSLRDRRRNLRLQQRSLMRNLFDAELELRTLQRKQLDQQL